MLAHNNHVMRYVPFLISGKNMHGQSGTIRHLHSILCSRQYNVINLETKSQSPWEIQREIRSEKWLCELKCRQ